MYGKSWSATEGGSECGITPVVGTTNDSQKVHKVGELDEFGADQDIIIPRLLV